MTSRLHGLKSVGLLAGLGLFTWIGYDTWQRAQSVGWPPLPWPALASASALLLLAYLIRMLSWTYGARHIAPDLTVRSGASVFALALLGRYIPGKLWQLGGLAALASRHGAPSGPIASFSLGFLVASQLLGLLTLAGCVLLRPLNTLALPLLALVAPLLALGVSILVVYTRRILGPRLPERWRLGQEDLLSWTQRCIMLSILVWVWLLFASAGHLLALGFSPAWVGAWPQTAAAVLAGLLAGFLVLIVPSGAGVRESTIAVWLVAEGVSAPSALLVAVSLRVVMTLGELLWAALGALIVLRPGETS